MAKSITSTDVIKYELSVGNLGLVAYYADGQLCYLRFDKLPPLQKFIHRILTENEQMQKALEKAGLNPEISIPENPTIQPEEKPKADDWVVSVDLLKERVRICENNIEHLEERAEENSDY